MIVVEPLTLYEDRAEMEQRETKIDVSGWRDRNPFRDRGPINIAGIEVEVVIPYSGDPSLWKLRRATGKLFFLMRTFVRRDVMALDRSEYCSHSPPMNLLIGLSPSWTRN